MTLAQLFALHRAPDAIVVPDSVERANPELIIMADFADSELLPRGFRIDGDDGKKN